MWLVAYQRCETIDDVGVANVLLLRRGRQCEVVADEPGYRPGLVAAHAVLETERLCIDGAEFGMVAAATFGDVMKQP